MFRRAVLVADQKSPGYWHNSKYSIVEELLDKAKVTHWTKAGVIGNVRESRKIAKETATAASDYNADLLHITNQEFAMLTPKNSDVPVVISVHNLFDFRPRSMDAGDVIVPLGDRNPSSAKLRKLEAIKSGMERADLLICDSEITLSDARLMFPETKSVMIRSSIDTDFWDPSRNPKDPGLLEEFEEGKCLLVSVGGEDSIWRGRFLKKVVDSLPEQVLGDISILRIGDSNFSIEQISAAYQNAEAMLYPGVSIGFRNPPLEAMASGCPVIASDLPTHNEFLPRECILDPTDVDAWCRVILEIHREWTRSGGVSRFSDESLISHAKMISSRENHGKKLSEVYDMASSGD